MPVNPVDYPNLVRLTIGIAIAAAVPVLIVLVLLWRARQRHRMLTERLRPPGAMSDSEGRDGMRPTGGVHGWWAERVEAWRSRVPTDRLVSDENRRRLLLAGYGAPAHASGLALLRLGLPVGGVALAFALPVASTMLQLTLALLALLLGAFGPLALLDRLGAQRQVAIRRAIPDTLDLLIISLEAGVSQDAAMQRVARELSSLHPLLGEELLDMSRRIAAGIPRDRAFAVLHERTGVTELRTLATHFIQADAWGTSITTVLRVYSEQLRNERRYAAEQRAATASTRMMVPLSLFIFPTLFVVLLGPAAIRMMGMLR